MPDVDTWVVLQGSRRGSKDDGGNFKVPLMVRNLFRAHAYQNDIILLEAIAHISFINLYSHWK